MWILQPIVVNTTNHWVLFSEGIKKCNHWTTYLSFHVTHLQTNSGPMTISLDGNFGLCHKKAAGASAHGPLSGESMFLNQSQVDTFVANYTCTTAAKVSIIPPISLGITSLFLFLPCVQECSDFLAGSALRSKTRYTWLDETAVMGAAAGISKYLLCFLNLWHGER